MSTHGKITAPSIDIKEEEIDALLDYFPQGVISFDLETTGLSPLTDRVIELSAVKIAPNRNIRTFSELVNPHIPIPKITTNIHGITDQMVSNCRSLDDVLEEFLDFCSEKPAIAHNASFDAGFLVFSIHHLKLQLPQLHIYCSCRFSRASFREFQGHSLKFLSEQLSIPLKNHHRALDDALACLRIFANALKHNKNNLDSKASDYLFKSSRLFNLQDFTKNKNMTLADHLLPLKGLTSSQTPSMLQYKGGSHGKNDRPIRPIGLLPMPSGNILYAHCLLSDMYKSFALSKIKSIREFSQEERVEFKHLLKNGEE